MENEEFVPKKKTTLTWTPKIPNITKKMAAIKTVFPIGFKENNRV